MSHSTAPRVFRRFRLITGLSVTLLACQDPLVQRGVANAGNVDADVEQAATVCGAGPTVPGIDVSSWQGNINWPAVAGAGYKFAIARVSDGFYHDTKFAQNWNGIKAAGMIRGVYQYFEPNLDPIAQANLVIEAVGALGPGDLPVMLDVETPSNNPSPGVYTARIHQWVDRITQATGRAPMIYTGRYYWPQYVQSGDFGNLALCHAQYTSAACPNIADAWGNWAIWQYSSTGSVPGISGNVDMDRFNGTEAQLQEWAQSNRAPRGWLDSTNCDAISGWAQDEDSPDATLAVHIYVNGPAGDPNATGYAIQAGNHREDLCAAIGNCNHGFSWSAPNGFRDGAAHPIYAYGIDTNGGNNPLLNGAPMVMQCNAPAPPVDAATGVKRHVPSPDAMSAWSFDWNDIATLPDATLNAYADGPEVPAAPVLVAVTGEPAIYVQEYGTVRHVQSPAIMDNWHFNWNAVQPVTSAQLGDDLVGAPVLGEPFLARGSGPAVYVVDAPPPLWAIPVATVLPPTLQSGQSKQVTWTLKNRGAMTWAPGQVWLVPVNPRATDGALCDPSWNSCQRVVSVASETAPGAVGTFVFTLRAPTVNVPTNVTQCLGLSVGTHFFSEAGQGGPADGALCASVMVVPVGQEAPDAGTTVTPDAGTTPSSSSNGPVTMTPDAGVSSSGTSSTSRPMEQPPSEEVPVDSTICDCARLPVRGGTSAGVWMALAVVVVRASRRRR